jgi:hypothetical protein
VNVPVIRTKNKRLENMFLPNNYNTTKLNKFCDVDTTNQSELADLIRDFFSVNNFQIGYDRKIKNKILKQIKNPDSKIVIRTEDFQINKKIFWLIRHISAAEIEMAVRLALENSFNCNLSRRKIIVVQEYPFSEGNTE